MAAIRADHDAQNRLIQTQKGSLISIINDLGSLRLMGKDTETPRTGTPALEASTSEHETSQPLAITISEPIEEGEDDRQSSDDVPLSASLNPHAKPFFPPSAPALPSLHPHRSLSSAAGSVPPSVVPSPAASRAEEDDIEMGEVAENPKSTRAKRRVRDEELEEGEASDESSELSDPPDD